MDAADLRHDRPAELAAALNDVEQDRRTPTFGKSLATVSALAPK